jgi:hypothetical protein
MIREYIELVEKACLADIQPKTDHLVTNPASEYGEYRARAGYIRGVRAAMQTMRDTYADLNNLERDTL